MNTEHLFTLMLIHNHDIKIGAIGTIMDDETFQKTCRQLEEDGLVYANPDLNVYDVTRKGHAHILQLAKIPLPTERVFYVDRNDQILLSRNE